MPFDSYQTVKDLLEKDGKMIGYLTVYSEEKSDLRDLKAVQRIATAYFKLLYPHITSVEGLNKDEFKLYCLNPAIRRRGIIKEQCHKIDEEFKEYMPEIRIK